MASAKFQSSRIILNPHKQTPTPSGTDTLCSKIAQRLPASAGGAELRSAPQQRSEGGQEILGQPEHLPPRWISPGAHRLARDLRWHTLPDVILERLTLAEHVS